MYTPNGLSAAPSLLICLQVPSGQLHPEVAAEGWGDLFADVARKGSPGCVWVSLAGCTPSQYGYGLKWGVFIRGIAGDGLIYPSSLYCASCASSCRTGFICDLSTQWGFKRSGSVLPCVRVRANAYEVSARGGTLLAAVLQTALHLFLPSGLEYNKGI